MEIIFTHIAKEVFETIRRPLLRCTAGAVSPSAQALITQMKKVGYAVVDEYWTKDKCDRAMKEIDRLCMTLGLAGSWVDDQQSDHRFFRAEQHAPCLTEFRDHPFFDEVRRGYTGRRTADKFVLAARLEHKKGNKGSGGGWHMDSPHSRQFKVIVYLSDVTDDNGPFQLLPKTHKRNVLSWLMVNGMRSPGQYRFTDEEEALIEKFVGQPKHFTARKGTAIFVDVTALHRGMPILAGSRYALTLYCGDPKNKSD